LRAALALLGDIEALDSILYYCVGSRSLRAQITNQLLLPLEAIAQPVNLPSQRGYFLTLRDCPARLSATDGFDRRCRQQGCLRVLTKSNAFLLITFQPPTAFLTSGMDGTSRSTYRSSGNR